MGDADTKTLIRDLALAGSGFWALSQANGKYQCASAGFMLYGIYGSLDALCTLVDDDNLKNVRDYTAYLCQTLCLPLFACEACQQGGIQKEYALLNLAIPGIDVVSKLLTGNDYDQASLVRTSHLVSVGSIGYVSFKKDNDVFGYVLALIYFLAEFSDKEVDEDMGVLLMALGSVVAYYHVSGSKPG